MSSSEDRLKGKVNEAVGKGKQGLGEASGDHEMKREGKAQEGRGKVQDTKGKVKDKIKGAVDDF